MGKMVIDPIKINVIKGLIVPINGYGGLLRKTLDGRRVCCRSLLVPDNIIKKHRLDPHLLKREFIEASSEIFIGRPIASGHLIIKDMETSPEHNPHGDFVDISLEDYDEIRNISPSWEIPAVSIRRPSGSQADPWPADKRELLTRHKFSLTRENLEALDYLLTTDGSAEQIARRDKYVPLVLGAIANSRGNINTNLKYFQRVLQLFCEETKAQPAPSQISRNIFALDKFDLLKAVGHNVSAVNVLTDRRLVSSRELRRLAIKAKFVYRLLILTLAEDPNSEIALQVTKKEGMSRAELLREFLSRMMNSDRLYLASRRKFEGSVLTEEETLDLYRRREKTLRHFANIHLARIAMLFLEEQEKHSRSGKGLAEFSRLLRGIYREKSNLSLVVLSAAYSINLRFLESIYGRPAGCCSVILGGANARHEFPSYDYDVITIFDGDKEAESNGGLCGSLPSAYYFHMLFGLLKTTLEDLDKSFDTRFQNVIGLRSDIVAQETDDLEYISVGNLDDYICHFSRQNARFYQDFIPMSNLVHGAGQPNLTTRFLEKVKELVLDPARNHKGIKAEILLNWYAKRNFPKTPYNIKHSSGGLRDLHSLLWFHGKSGDTPYALPEIFAGDPDIGRQLVTAYTFLMNLRIRMDLYYGRNEKDLPTGRELKDFTASLGYTSIRDFEKDYKYYTSMVAKIVDRHFNEAMAEDPELKVLLDTRVAEEKQKSREADEKKAQEAEEKFENKVADKLKEAIQNNPGRDPIILELWSRRVARGED